MKQTLPGMLICLCVAIPAWFLGKLVPAVGGAVFSILFGIILGSFFQKPRFLPGIKFTGKKILQYAIILLGFEMQIIEVLKTGSKSLVIMAFTLTAAFVTAAIFYRLLRVGGKSATLIGVGSCICGGSAIAATAPIIGADDQETSRAISTIFLFNIVAVFLFPALGRAMGLTDQGFGLWAGTAINDTSSVVAAGSVWSEAAGNGTALALATIVKLTRTLLIIPITLALALIQSRTAKKNGTTASGYHFAKIFPWFVIGFALAAVINSFLGLPPAVTKNLATAGKFLIVMAMAAIGLSTNAKTLFSAGWRGLVLGLCCWAAVAVTSLAAQRLSGLL